jgi:alkylation response protein AidB-like acyl-CoA dehydrogenase
LAACFQNKLAPYEAGVEETQVVRPELANELRKKAEDLGLLALGLPEEVGGGGLNTIDGSVAKNRRSAMKSFSIHN